MSLSTTQYGYIVDPMVPFTDDKGKTIKNGFIRVFMAGTSTPVLTYRNYDGATNQEKIELDNSGRVKYNVIGSKGSLYKVVVYDAHHSQETPILTVDKIAVLGASINATGATIVTGLDSVTVQEENFIKATVEGTSVELSLDPTEVASELSTIGAAETAAPDYVVPLLEKTGTEDSKKISLANLFKFALDRISRLATTITSFASGDFIAVSNPTDGTRKMSKDTLLTLTSQNALAGNVAPAFVPNSTTTVAGRLYMYNGSLYMANEVYQGAWNASKFTKKNVNDLLDLILTDLDSISLFSDKFKNLLLKDIPLSPSANSPTSLNLPALVQGGWYAAEKRDNSKRLRIDVRIPLFEHCIYELSVQSGYKVNALLVDIDESGNFIYTTSAGEPDLSITITGGDHDFAEIMVKKEDDTQDISTSEIDDIGLEASVTYVKYDIAPYPKRISSSSEDVEYGTIEQGSYSSTTKVNSDMRIRTSDKFRLIPGSKYVFSCNSGYLVNVNEANEDGSYAGEYFGPEETIEFIANAPFAVMVIRKNDGSEISPSDFSAVGLTAKVYPIENDEVVGKSGTEKLVYELCGNLWLGKKANFLGDSITAGYVIGSQYSWIETCKKVLGLSVARNYGISASTIAAGYQPFSDRYADMDNDADLIVVLGSRNDFANNVPIGSSADEDNTTFYGAMKILAEGLWAKYPTKTVVFCTQFKAMKQRDGYIERDSNPNSAGNNQEAYNEVIREVCKAHAFPVIDLYYDGVFNSWNDGMRSAFFIDTVHPNIEGDVFLGEKIASRLKMI